MKFARHALAAAAVLALPGAHAFDIEIPDSDTKVRLDLTPKYSLGVRLRNPSPALTAFNPAVDPGTLNEDDGDRNFRRGLISDRVDLLAELDVSSPRGFGGRVSATAWYDQVYMQRNDNRGAQVVGAPDGTVVPTANVAAGGATDRFLAATQRQMGRGGNVLDAFVYVKGEVGGMDGTLRLGRHSLQWGESLFFGQNGIANAQGPVDIARILSVPGWQFKEVLLPVEQVSGSLQVAEGVSLGAYYQFKWRPSRIPGVGSYFSNQDYIGTGSVNFGSSGVLYADGSKDIHPRDSGQGGLQLKIAPTGGNFEYGFYAAQFHDKAPAVPVFDFVNGNVHTVWAQDVRTVGASVTSSVGQLNWAAEASLRWNAALNSDPAVLGPGPVTHCDNSRDTPCYAVGRTAHINVSGIYVLQPTALWQGGALLGEIAWNDTLKVTRDIFANADGSSSGLGGLDPNTTRSAFASRLLFEPQYFQVLPGVDLSVPIGLGFNFGGKSSAMASFAGGAAKAGDYSVGLKAKVQNAWNLQMAWQDYFGKAATLTTTLVPGSGSPRALTFGQTLRDRGFLTMSVSRTF